MREVGEQSHEALASRDCIPNAQNFTGISASQQMQGSTEMTAEYI